MIPACDYGFPQFLLSTGKVDPLVRAIMARPDVQNRLATSDLEEASGWLAVIDLTTE